MKIGGLQKISLIDYPKKISCVVFTQGCNFRCYYCHNPELVYPELFNESISLEEVFTYVKKRKGIIDSVVFCGGEPTLQNDIYEVVCEVKKLGFLVKLDTNGSNPEVLDKLISYLDYVSLDIKAPLDKEKYEFVCRTEVDIEKIKESIKILRKSKIEYEFRMTYDQKMMPLEWKQQIKSILKKSERFIVKDASFEYKKFKFQ
jgi:pyruvate formate lyase activating enzyme